MPPKKTRPPTDSDTYKEIVDDFSAEQPEIVRPQRCDLWDDDDYIAELEATLVEIIRLNPILLSASTVIRAGGERVFSRMMDLTKSTIPIE